MRLIILVAFAAAGALGQPSTVTVAGPVYTPGGAVANGGTVTATLAAACVVGTTYIHRGPVSATVASDGTLSIALVPTASCATSGNSYSVRYRVTRGGVPLTEYSETWTIPASPSSTTIMAVRSNTIPSPLAAVSWTQLTSIPTPVSAIIASVSSNRVFAGPASGAAAVGAYRALVAADLPSQIAANNTLVEVGASTASSAAHGIKVWRSSGACPSSFDYSTWCYQLDGAVTASQETLWLTGRNVRLGPLAISSSGDISNADGGQVAIKVAGNRVMLASTGYLTFSPPSGQFVDFQMTGGAGYFLRTTESASVGTPAIDSPPIHLRGQRWDGASSSNLDYTIQGVATSSSPYGYLALRSGGVTRVWMQYVTGYIGVGVEPSYPVDVNGAVNATSFRVGGTAGVTASGSTCTITAISGGIITGASCAP